MATQAQRQKAYRDRLNVDGFSQVLLTVPREAVADLQMVAEMLRASRHLTVGSLRDPVSGRLVGLRPTR